MNDNFIYHRFRYFLSHISLPISRYIDFFHNSPSSIANSFYINENNILESAYVNTENYLK